MNKRYYKKKGASYKERLRCPLCGKLSPIGYFSQDHAFTVVRYRYGGKSDISVMVIDKDPVVMMHITNSIVQRLKDLISKLSGKPIEGRVHPPLKIQRINLPQMKLKSGRIKPKEVRIE